LLARIEKDDAGPLECALHPEESVRACRAHAVDGLNPLDRRQADARAIREFCPRPTEKRTRSAGLRTCKHLIGI
jgi:hypothetical protein